MIRIPDPRPSPVVTVIPGIVFGIPNSKDFFVEYHSTVLAYHNLDVGVGLRKKSRSLFSCFICHCTVASVVSVPRPVGISMLHLNLNYHNLRSILIKFWRDHSLNSPEFYRRRS